LTSDLLGMYIVCMRAVWDPGKAAANQRKHGIRFADAELVLFDPAAITVEDFTAEDERRHVSLGADALGRVLVIVYTYSDQEEVRLISARRATRKERRQYEEGIRL